ncbi:MAG: hypothetical protein QOE23_3394 [Pseudonocardiales bacterium]|jgi:YVTN family beta-propeller protein|nr:hypothetical protein [Pseudonocardiales bacterium]
MASARTRSTWRRCAAAVVLALLAAATSALSPAPAGADLLSGFALPGYDVRLALANHRVFDAASDLADDSVHVYDLSGQQLATIPGEPDVRALTASPDGSRLYVALGTSQAVSVIDTSTLTELTRYDVSALGAPVQFAEAGDRLFVAGSPGPWDLEVGVVDRSQPGSSATAIYRGDAPWAQLAAFESSPGVSELYVTGCSFSGICPLDHYVYTEEAGAALQQRDYLDTPRGMALSTDGSALLTPAADDAMSVRDPADLSIVATIPGAYDGAWMSVIDQRLVQVAFDKLANNYAEVQVRDLSGELSFSYRAGRGLIPLTEPGSTDVYAAVLGSDMTWHLETLPGALGTPSAPAGPQGLIAVARPGGAVALSWTPVSLRTIDAPTSYRLYRSSVAGALGAGLATRLPATARSYTDPAPVPGIRYYYTLVASGIAGDSPASTQVAATADASAPKPVLTRPAAPVQLARAITVSYAATDTGSGVASYDVRYRTSGWTSGGFSEYGYPAGWQHTTATSQTLTGTPGHEYCISVRSRDRVGNLSAWTADRCTALPLDDRSLRTSPLSWARPPSAGSYLGTLTRTNTLGAQLQLYSAQTDRIALVVAQCPTCGNVAIYLNNVYWRTVSTYAATTRRGVILLQPGFSQRTTTITLRNASVGKDLIIDGLGILRG